MCIKHTCESDQRQMDQWQFHTEFHWHHSHRVRSSNKSTTQVSVVATPLTLWWESPWSARVSRETVTDLSNCPTPLPALQMHTQIPWTQSSFWSGNNDAQKHAVAQDYFFLAFKDINGIRSEEIKLVVSTLVTDYIRNRKTTTPKLYK